MLEQRKRLGMLGAGSWEIAEPLQLVPVIAVGLPLKGADGPQRMAAVCEAVRQLQPELLEGLEIWVVSPANDRASSDQLDLVRPSSIDELIVLGAQAPAESK